MLLKVVDVETGEVRTLADTLGVEAARGGTWGRDGTILYSPNFMGGLMRVAADGSGAPAPATEPEGALSTHRHPAFLPDGSHFVFFASPGGEEGEIRLGELGATTSTIQCHPKIAVT